jgi:hypothetical protein
LANVQWHCPDCVLGVKSNQPFHSWGKPRQIAGTAMDIADALPVSAWRRLSAGAGNKGEPLRFVDGIAALAGRAKPAARAVPLGADAGPRYLADDEWIVCAHVLGEASDAKRRAQFDAILWVAETGRPWRSLPAGFCRRLIPLSQVALNVVCLSS